MKAGIDFGTTLVKAYWQETRGEQYATSADSSVSKIADRLTKAGVTRLSAIGIGSMKGFEDFDVCKADDPVTAEKTAQALGVRRILPALPEKFLLVSIGTGTSYTEVEGATVVGSPLGNPMGGGFIAGMARVFFAGVYEGLADLAERGTPPDTLMKHMLPPLDGSLQGEFVVSHFNRAGDKTTEEDFVAGLIHCVAVSVIRDVMSAPSSDVVFIGTSVSAYPALRSYLTRYALMLGKTAHFPERGEFAGAVGAYHRDA